MACGPDHALIQDQEHLVSYGLNSSGQLGKPKLTHVHTHMTDPCLGLVGPHRAFHQGHVCLGHPSSWQVEQVACGREHTLISLTNGHRSRVFGCGQNALGQLGHLEPGPCFTPIEIPSIPRARVKQLVAGLDHSLLLTTTGKVYATGWHSDGQCGLGQEGPSCQFGFTPVDALRDQRITRLASTSDHVLALSESGHLYAWGNSEYGQGMTGKAEDRILTPVQVTQISDLIVDMAAGTSFSILLTKDGSVYSCGYGNIHGREGVLEVPGHGLTRLPMPIRVVRVYAAGDYCAAIGVDGSLWTWGLGRDGQLGLGNMKVVSSPTRIPLTQSVENVALGLHTMLIQVTP